MITVMSLMLVSLVSLLSGMLIMLGYMLYRMMKNESWDDSNLLNALRLISHVTLHPHDFGKMWYVSGEGKPLSRPFWYIDKDELSEVVKSRPNSV